MLRLLARPELPPADIPRSSTPVSGRTSKSISIHLTLWNTLLIENSSNVMILRNMPKEKHREFMPGSRCAEEQVFDECACRMSTGKASGRTDGAAGSQMHPSAPLPAGGAEFLASRRKERQTRMGKKRLS